MIINLSDLEETAQTSPDALEVFTQRKRSLGRSPGAIGSGSAQGNLFFDEIIFNEMGYLNEDGTFTELGFDIARQVRTSTRRVRVRHLHAHETNVFDLYCGNDFDIVFASINDHGVATGHHIFSRTVPVSGLHHLLSWAGVPALNTEVPASNQLSLDASFLDSPDLIAQHGMMWEVSSTISPEVTVFGLYDGVLWLLDRLEEDNGKVTAFFEHHDAMTINLLLHRLWALAHGFDELL